MKLRVSILAAGFVVALILPFGVHGSASGPDAGLAGVPGELGTCASCHGTASSVNKNGGSVSINFGSGNKTYVPGETQTWIVTVTDPSARRWGFEAAARTASNTSAGGFVSTDSNTQVVCSSSAFRGSQRATNGTCPTSTPLMYAEQTLAGTRLGTTGSVTFQFNWKAPATDVGAVTVYIAANAANGNSLDDSGDHVYTATYILTAASASTISAPTISSNGVVNGASFAPSIAAGSWVTIQGANLTTATGCDPVNAPKPGCRTWSTADFANGTPTSLDGVSVSIGGKAAYVYYVSPTQINVQAPDIGTGPVAATVTNSAGTSNSVSVTADSFSPAFFLAGQYAIATHADGTLVAPAGAFPNSSPAKRGETIVLWGTGFGPVSPSVPAGKMSADVLGSQVAYVATPPTLSIGGVAAAVIGAALNPSALGLYQIAITVPDAAPTGDQVIVAGAGGAFSPTSGVLFTVQ